MVPEALELSGLQEPDRELPPAALAVLMRVIQFNFGTLHTQRVEAWWRRVLPRHEVIAMCRTYDTALALVEAGLGVAQMPLLTVQQGRRLLGRVRLYDAGIAPGGSSRWCRRNISACRRSTCSCASSRRRAGRWSC